MWFCRSIDLQALSLSEKLFTSISLRSNKFKTWRLYSKLSVVTSDLSITMCVVDIFCLQLAYAAVYFLVGGEKVQLKMFFFFA